MKKIILFLILIIFLSGCSVFNLNGFVLPDDIEFISCIETLDTPEKICAYMKENFTYKKHYFYNPDPYTLWKTRKGDCNDLVTFAMFVANFHGYKTYQIQISFKGTSIKHVLAVYLEDGKYTYSNFKAYYPLYVLNFNDIITDYFSTTFEYELRSYKVYDYNMNLIEN